MTSPPEEGRSLGPTTGPWRDWSRLLVVAELVLVAGLLLRQGPQPVPALADLQRATATLAEVKETCRTDPVAGGPATVTFCHVELVFAGAVGRVRDPYGRLFPPEAAAFRNALLPLHGRAVEVWLLPPEGGGGRPEIWQLTYGGEAVIAYADVAVYHAEFDREFGRVFGLPSCVVCLVGASRGLRRERSLGRPPGQDAVARADVLAERALDGVMGLALLWAVSLCLEGDGGDATVVVMLCVFVSFLYWPDRNRVDASG